MLGKLARKAAKLRLKTPRLAIRSSKDEILLLDFTDKTIRLPNGDLIRRDDIISFDPQTSTLIYRTPTGELKTLQLDTPLDKLIEALTGEKMERKDTHLHI